MIKINSVERHLFFEGILLQYGYDFRQYAEASLDRRLSHLLGQYRLESPLDLLKIVLKSNEDFRKVLGYLTINTTEFFRDPKFFKLLREQVFPVLSTYSKITIWSAGCSSGEEVLSLAICLKEEDLLKRTTIHATDISPAILKKARDGIFDASVIPHFNRNYSAAGGRSSPSEYYSADYGLVRFHRDLLEPVVFNEHNLVTDSAFTEAQLILCRNVMIYFNRELQNRTLELFTQSLVHKGFLCIGPKESLRFSSVHGLYQPLPGNENIFFLNSRSERPEQFNKGSDKP